MTELSGKRIVMTGATGFIGSHVAKRFLEAGAEVYCLVRLESQKTDCLPVHEHLHRIPAQMDQAVECDLIPVLQILLGLFHQIDFELRVIDQRRQAALVFLA